MTIINTRASQNRQSLAVRYKRLECRNNKNHIIDAYFLMQCLLKFICVIIQVLKMV